MIVPENVPDGAVPQPQIALFVQSPAAVVVHTWAFATTMESRKKKHALYIFLISAEAVTGWNALKRKLAYQQLIDILQNQVTM